MTFKFDHVHLVCEDVEGMMAFFERIFEAKQIGFVPDFKGSASGILELGGIRIFVRGMRPDWIPDCVAPARVQGLDHFGLTADDVIETAKTLKARGADISVEPHPGGFGGRYICYVKGPENIDIEISGPWVGIAS